MNEKCDKMEINGNALIYGNVEMIQKRRLM